jgi:hypothetical protein
MRTRVFYYMISWLRSCLISQKATTFIDQQLLISTDNQPITEDTHDIEDTCDVEDAHDAEVTHNTEDAEGDDEPLLPPSSRLSSPASGRPVVPNPLSGSTLSTSHTPSSTSTASKRKQSALSATQSSSSSKKQHTNSGAVLMYGIRESLDNFNATVSKSALMQADRFCADTSPECLAKAVELIQEQEDYLSDDQMVAFLDLFQADTAAADIYLAIKQETLWKAWIQKQLLKDLEFPASTWLVLWSLRVYNISLLLSALFS